MGLEDALIQAMEELPEGWNVQLLIKKGSVWVGLCGPQEHILRFEYLTIEHLFNSINQAVAKARKETEEPCSVTPPGA